MKAQTITPWTTTETIPLAMDDDGVIHIANTRVTLDTIIAGFMEGATAEEIVQQYPSISLADVYYVIGYYLRRRSEVETYLNRRQRQAEQVRQQNEARFDPDGVRERLMARRSSGRR